MGIKQKIRDAKQEYSEVYKEARDRRVTESTQRSLEKQNDEHNRQIKEASKRLLKSHVRKTGESSEWTDIRHELEPQEGHLVLISNLYHAHGSGSFTKNIAERMRTRLGGREVVVGFSVHCADDRVTRDDPRARDKFMTGAMDLRRDMRTAGFDVLAEVSEPEHRSGLGIPQIVAEAAKTEATAEGESKDYLHFAVVSGLELPEAGLDYSHNQMKPLMLMGFNDSDMPIWTDLTKPGGNIAARVVRYHQ